MDIQYAFRIPAELLDQVRKLAEEQDLTLAQVFRKLAKEYVEGGGKK